MSGLFGSWDCISGVTNGFQDMVIPEVGTGIGWKIY